MANDDSAAGAVLSAGGYTQEEPSSSSKSSIKKTESIEEYISNFIKGRRMNNAENNLSVHKTLVAAAKWRQKQHGIADLSKDLED